LERGSATSQAQLFPITVEFNAADHALITGLLPDLHAMGFQLEALSGRSFSVNGLPADVGEEDPSRAIERFLEQVKNERSALKNERHATLARSMARVLAVREPRLLDERSMHDLIDRLFACEMPYFTPGGKPVLITYSLQDLDERFQR
jgi:DNA mismatch repair protein MutL